MRLRFAVVLMSVAACVAVAACGEGGNGTGSAPPAPPACPSTVPVPASDCTALQVCDYAAESKVAVCPYAGGQWTIHERGEAGTFADAEIPEVAVDSASDGASEASDAMDDATDAMDAMDAMDAVDAVGETPADAEPDTLVTDTASDGG